MKTNRINSFVAILCVALATAACSKGLSSPAAPTNTTTLSFSGVFAGATEGGTFQLSAAVPVSSATFAARADVLFQSVATVAATGTLKIAAGSTITLTGTYNPATKVFTMSGSSYSLTATVANNAVAGTYTGPSTSGSVSALPAPPGVTVTSYCGTFAGTESGRWNVAMSAGVVTGAASTPEGSVQLSGTLSGTAITMSWHPNDTDVGNTIGTLSGASISGTWSTNTPGDHGTWNGSSGSC